MKTRHVFIGGPLVLEVIERTEEESNVIKLPVPDAKDDIGDKLLYYERVDAASHVVDLGPQSDPDADTRLRIYVYRYVGA